MNSRECHDFTAQGDAYDLKISDEVVKALRYKCDASPKLFVRNTQYDIYITESVLKSRLTEDSSKRKADYEKVKANEDPFTVYNRHGQLRHIPAHLISTKSIKGKKDAKATKATKDIDYNDEMDDRQLIIWQNFYRNLAKAEDKAGINPTYARFVLAPKTSTEVFFTPMVNGPFLGVTKDLLKTVINEETDNSGNYKNWKLTALTCDEADQKNLKLVGTNSMKLYHAWMNPEDYATLWASKNNTTTLLFPFPKNNKGTRDRFAELHKGLNAGTIQVDGVDVPLSTKKMQHAYSQRETTGKKGYEIMGKSATALNDLWGPNYPKTGMTPNWQSEWLHRIAYSYGGVTNNIKSCDDPGNIIFGSAECNTDMIRAENSIKNLLTQYGKRKFDGVLTTTCTRTGVVTRKDLLKDDGLVTFKADIPLFLSVANYPWLCFELKYVFTMLAKSSPLNCDTHFTTKFEPWSLYVPLAIEPRMDDWLIDYLRDHPPTASTKHKKPNTKAKNQNPNTKGLTNFSFLLQAEMETNNTDLDIPTVAWKAAQAGLPELEIPGMVIKNPRVQTQDPDVGPTRNGIDIHEASKTFALPIDAEFSDQAQETVLQGDADTGIPPEGFVLEGDIEIFGTPIIGQLQKWMGPPPADVVVGADPACWERVTLPGDFHLSTLLPALKDTPYDFITFRNVAFWYQNYEFDKTRGVGWHFDADWVIEPSCGVLYDVLRTLLQIDQPILSIRTELGLAQQWDSPLNVHSFTLEGTFAGLTLSPIDGLQLTSIGVRLLGIRGFELSPKPHTTLSYGFSIFGTMAIVVPGSIIPLHLDYSMGINSGNVNISAELSGDIWENALGVENLMLEDVTFMTSFALSSPWKSLSFSTSATFWHLNSQVILSGTFAPGNGQLSLSAEFDDFDAYTIHSIFYSLFEDPLSLPDFDLHIGSAILSIGSGVGVSLALQNVNVAGHTALDVAVSLSSSGAQLSGALSSDKISLGEVSIHNAALNIAFWTEEKKKKVDLMLAGSLSVDFLGVAVDAVVHLYPGSTGTDWTVIAGLSTHEKPIAISDVVSLIEKGSYLDLSLTEAFIIAASKDDPAASTALPHNYTVRQGIQIAAVIESFPLVDTLLRTKVSGLILSAGWSKESGFALDVLLPASTTMDFGHGIRSTPISLGIRTKPAELAVSAGLTVPVKDSAPLVFTFVLEASAIEASASADMQRWWVEPFGIHNIKVGPEVILSINIVYQAFMATGTPTGFAVGGGLMIGSTPLNLLMSISENPHDELLQGSLQNLDISDVIEYAGKLVEADIPKIPNMLKFEELSIYVCPFGVTLAKKTYPAGFSFMADMLFLNHRANIECTIDEVAKSFSLKGGVDNFELGPLSVHGATGPRATIECELGVSKQELIIDGVVGLFDAQLHIYINTQFLPSPKLKFHTLLQFAHVLTYQLDAELLGSLENLKDADFSLTSVFENHILEYVAQQVTEQLEAFKVAAAHGLQVAQDKVEDAKKQWQAGVDDAEARLHAAQEKWEEYEKSIRGSNQPIIDNWLAKIDELEGAIKDAQKTFDSAMAEATNKMEQANRDRGAAMAEADHKVLEAKQKMDDDIKVAQQAFDVASAAVSQAFGKAEAVIKDAENDVAGWQTKIDDVLSKMHEYGDAPFWPPWKKFAYLGLGAELATLEASKLFAEGALKTAEAILEGADYLSKVADKTVAKTALESAETVGQTLLDAARALLAETDKTTQRIVEEATHFVHAMETGVEYVLLQGAITACEDFKTASRAAYDAAVSAIEGLMKAAEYFAFTAARSGVLLAKGFTKVLDATKEALHLAEEASGAIVTIMEDIVKFGAKAVNIEAISLSGTLRGALGLGGDSSRPLSASVEGYLLGNHFKVELQFDPKDSLAFIKALFTHLWDILKGALNVVAGAVEDVAHGNVKFALESTSFPEMAADYAPVAFRTVVSFKGDIQWLDGFLPPPPSQRAKLSGVLGFQNTRKYIAPLIAVEDQVTLLPFAVARQRFIEYRVEGTHEDAERAEQQGLVGIPLGPFTSGPPLTFSKS